MFLVKFCIKKKCKTDFQDGSFGSQLGFLTGMSLALFDLQVTPMLPTKFLINCSRGVGEVALKANC